MISVLTTPRRQEYLRDTLKSIDDAGAATLKLKCVYVDGGITETVRQNLLPGWALAQLHPGSEARGTRLSLWRILNRAARSGCTYLLHFEDDVRVCRNGIHAMSAIDCPPDAGFLSFFQQNKGMPGTPGFHFLPPGQNWWGAQALKIPARSLAKFKDEKSAPPPRHFGMQCDIWLGQQLRGCVLLPSLVRHVGLRTTIETQAGETLSGESAHRAGLHYVGDDFDALFHPLCPPVSARTLGGADFEV